MHRPFSCVLFSSRSATVSASELSGPPQTPTHAGSSDQEPMLVLPQISCAVLDRKVSVCLSFSICKIRMMLHCFTSAAKFSA